MASNRDAGAVLDRLWEAFGVDSDSALCEALGVKRSTLGGWRSRDKVPYAECVIATDKTGLSLDWLLTGTGPMYRDWLPPAADALLPHPTPHRPELSQAEADLLATFRALPPEDQQVSLCFVEDRHRMRQLEQQIKELAAAVAEGKPGP